MKSYLAADDNPSTFLKGEEAAVDTASCTILFDAYRRKLGVRNSTDFVSYAKK